ncbi:hypothetical protein VNO80_03523 [Phaseolus coccineus]|uniref:Uncharacterized protein n=1 Tax=Phaseolus coccineus TaxID=3886 RepID=A0AAN9NSE4_PHACN
MAISTKEGKRYGQAIETSPEGAEAGEAIEIRVGSGAEQRDAARKEEDSSQVMGKMKDTLKTGAHHEHASGSKQPSQAEQSRRRKLVRRRPLASLTGSPLFLSVEGNDYNLRSRSRKATTRRGNDEATAGDASGGARGTAKVDGDAGYAAVIDSGTTAKEKIREDGSSEVRKGEGDRGERDRKEREAEGMLLSGIKAVIMGGGDQSERDSERQSELEFTPSEVATENHRLLRWKENSVGLVEEAQWERKRLRRYGRHGVVGEKKVGRQGARYADIARARGADIARARVRFKHPQAPVRRMTTALRAPGRIWRDVTNGGVVVEKEYGGVGSMVKVDGGVGLSEKDDSDSGSEVKDDGDAGLEESERGGSKGEENSKEKENSKMSPCRIESEGKGVGEISRRGMGTRTLSRVTPTNWFWQISGN